MKISKLWSYDEDYEILTNVKNSIKDNFNIELDFGEGMEPWKDKMFVYPFIWSESLQLDCSIKVERFNNDIQLTIAMGEEGEDVYQSGINPNEFIKVISGLITKQ